MILNTIADNTPANTTEGNGNNNNTTANNVSGKGTRKKKNNNKGNGNDRQMTTPKFEGHLKEDNFKEVVIKYGKLSIQSQILHLACAAHTNAKNQPFVTNSITFK